MTIPTFPTDNLYKFLALSGLFLLVFGVVYPLNRLTELQLKQAQINTESQILSLEVSRLKDDKAEIQKKVQGLRVTPDGKDQNAKNLLDPIAKIRDRSYELEIKQISIDGKQQEVSIVLDEISFMRQLFRYGFVLGGVATVVGFVGWHLRVEHPQDILLRNSLRSSRLLGSSEKLRSYRKRKNSFQ